jgi:hypothetical protein
MDLNINQEAADGLISWGTFTVDSEGSRKIELKNKTYAINKLGLRDGMMNLYYSLRFYNYEAHTDYAIARLSHTLTICAILKCNLKALDDYIEALDRNECVEVLDLQFWNLMNNFPRYEGSILEKNLLSKNASLKDYNVVIDKCIEGRLNDTRDIHNFLKEGIEELMFKLAIAQEKLFKVNPSFYIGLYEEEKKRFNLGSVTPAYNFWRLSVPVLNYLEVKKKQTLTVADFVKWGGLRHAADPSNEDLEKVYEEKVKQFMPHNYEYPIDFKQRCAVVRKYLYWNGELLFINKAKMAWYMHRYYYLMTDDEFLEIFKLEDMLSLINEDMKSCTETEKKDEKNEECGDIINDVVGACFRNVSEFVHDKVMKIVNTYYLGSAVNLTLIETTFYDHNLLKKRNAHKALIKALMVWGAIPVLDEKEIIKITNGMAYKMGQLPTNGYKEWDGNIYFNEKKVCSDIGKVLGPTITYHRKTED